MNREQKLIRSKFLQLTRSDKKAFPKRDTPDAPKRQGVYIIYNSKGKVFHVGNTPRGTKGIHNRLCDHLYGRSSFARKFLQPKNITLRNGYAFCFLAVKKPRHRTLIEYYAIGYLCPKHVGTGEFKKK